MFTTSLDNHIKALYVISNTLEQTPTNTIELVYSNMYLNTI